MVQNRHSSSSGCGGHAINNHYDVIISVAPAPPDSHTASYLWRRGTYRQLGDFTLGSTLASSINDRGQVIGSREDAETGQWHAFVFHDGRMINLTRLLPPDSVPRAMNNHGIMIGTLRTRTGQDHAALFLR
jgi:probable HAF family extracellular repeat protein